MPRTTKTLCLAALIGWAAAWLGAQEGNVRSAYETDFIDPLAVGLAVEPRPVLSSRSAIVFDQDSGAVLYQHNPDEIIPPASLTKLVVFDLAWDYLAERKIQLDSVVDIPSQAYAKNMPVRSSLMFLGPNQRCTWRDLLTGLAVDSGNDAAMAMALLMSGSEEAFVKEMNDHCARLGMAKTHFVEPSGYSERNLTSARDLAYFTWRYINRHPRAIAEFHSLRSFVYPHGDGNPSIRQVNRNRLLFAYPGADGLKTGYIDESGYNLAFTAQRDGMRLSGIILGGLSEPKRYLDAKGLLDYGFERFHVVKLDYPAPAPIEVWNGDRAGLALGGGSFKACLPSAMGGALQVRIRQRSEVEGPLAAGTVLAWAEYRDAEGRLLLRQPLRAAERVGEGNFLAAFGENVYLRLRSLAGRPWPAKASAPFN